MTALLLLLLCSSTAAAAAAAAASRPFARARQGLVAACCARHVLILLALAPFPWTPRSLCSPV